MLNPTRIIAGRPPGVGRRSPAGFVDLAPLVGMKWFLRPTSAIEAKGSHDFRHM